MADSSSGNVAQFSQVTREATLAEKVEARITSAIMDGSLSPGQSLVSERDLGEQFGVSRTVVREAVRSLVASGLVESHTGRGLRVAKIGPEPVSRAMSIFIHLNGTINYGRVHEVRQALEIDMAGYAAERATPEDIARMTKLTTELDAWNDAEGVEGAAELDVAFHQAIADATQNELFPMLLGAMNDVLIEVRRRAFASSQLRSYAVQAHREILDRIASSDVAEARQAMRRHLERSVQAWAADGNPHRP